MNTTIGMMTDFETPFYNVATRLLFPKKKHYSSYKPSFNANNFIFFYLLLIWGGNDRSCHSAACDVISMHSAYDLYAQRRKSTKYFIFRVLKMNSNVYKWCAVPLCKTTSIETPNKFFL